MRILINLFSFVLGVCIFCLLSLVYVAISEATTLTRDSQIGDIVVSPIDGQLHKITAKSYINDYTNCCTNYVYFAAGTLISSGRWSGSTASRGILYTDACPTTTSECGPWSSGKYWKEKIDFTFSTVVESGEPAHCTNNVKEAIETGIDCGGPCAAPCVERCPSGSTSVFINSLNESLCVHYAIPDAAGNCPKGYQLSTVTASSPDLPLAVGEKVCAVDAGTILASANVPNSSLPSVDSPDGWQSGTLNITESTPSITNNPDGTSKVTVTTTTTTNNGYTTTTVTNNYYSGPNGTGEKTGSDTTTTNNNPEEEPRNYDYNPQVAIDDSVTLSPSEYGEMPNWESLKQNLDSRINQVESAIKGTTIETSAQTCEITFTLLNRQMTISFCKYESILNTAGVLLLSLTYVLGMIYLWERG